MGLEKGIIKANHAASQTFDFKPRDIKLSPSGSAVEYAEEVIAKPSAFAISDLLAQQTGITKLQSEAQQDSINAKVLEKLKEVEEKAYKEGFDLGTIEGSEKAFVEAQASLLESQKALENIVKSIENLKRQILTDNEEALVNLLFQIGKRIALRDLTEHREAAVEILKDVLLQMSDDEKITVKLSPEDLYFIETLQDKAKEKIQGLERTRLLGDESVKSGGALIESEFGTVDATVEERVERVWQTLQSKIPKRNANTDGT